MRSSTGRFWPLRRWCLAAALGALCLGCQDHHAPLPTVAHVDLQRFMGRWYVIASIPTRIERGAHNATESYQLRADGSIDTIFTFNQNAPDGPVKTYHPRGFVVDRGSNAIWGMRFVWPIKADYRIIYLDADYTQTVIGRTARDYVWIMSRTPVMSPPDYQRLREFVVSQGYDLGALQAVPQLPPVPRS